MWQPDTILLLFFGALCFSAGCTWLLLWKRGTLGMDVPDRGRKKHDAPVLRLGGVPVFLALCAGFAALAWRQPEFLHVWAPLMICNTLVFLVGFLDDLKPLGARIKLVGQIGAALILYAMGVSIDVLSNPFGEGSIELGWWSLPLTLFWLVAIPNIINLIDGMDGLATGFGMFLCMTLAFVGHFSFKPDIVLMSMVMAGALAGFLFFNFPPARIFLGDGGAYLIGFFVASVSLVGSNKGSVIASLLVIIIALGVPILDTTFAIIRRAVRGIPIFRADAEHIHHRLILIGFSKARALVAIYTTCLVLSILGLSIFWSRGLSLPIAGAALCLLALGAARYLGYIKSWRHVRAQFDDALIRRKEMLYATTYARVMEWEVDRCKNLEEFMPLLHLALNRVGLRTEAPQNHQPVEIRLLSGGHCILHAPAEEEAHVLWQARADLFAPVISLAGERWGLLPGIPVTREHADDDAQPPSDEPTPRAT